MKHLITSAQINDYLGIPDWLIKGIQYLLVILCLSFLVFKLVSTPFLTPEIASMNILPVVGVVVLLMPVNWGLEALRWKVSVPEDQISFNQSLKTVLSGMALNWGLPFTSGDVIARVAASTHRRSSAVALLVNRAFMMIITFVFGFFSVAAYFQISVKLWVVLLLSLVTIISFASVGKLFRSEARWLWFKILGLSLLRYTVFTFQFFLLFKLFNPDLPSSLLLLGIGWTFLFRTVVPSFFGNIGIREASSLLFFDGLVASTSSILIPCLLVWLINMVIPSIYGFWAILILKVRTT